LIEASRESSTHTFLMRGNLLLEEGHTLKFKIGDKVVYPNHGIGVVKEIKDLNYGGESSKFISLQIVSTDSTVMVPVKNSQTVGLRKLVSKTRVRKVLEKLRTVEVTVPQDWKGRYQENLDKMRSGDIELVSEVLKNLTYLSSVKTLSYRERKMLDRARGLVVAELSEASQQDAQKIEMKIDEAMGTEADPATTH